jgi:hypothetical protein
MRPFFAGSPALFFRNRMMTGSYNIVTYTLETMVDVADIDETAMAALSNI